MSGFIIRLFLFTFHSIV